MQRGLAVAKHHRHVLWRAGGSARRPLWPNASQNPITAFHLSHGGGWRPVPGHQAWLATGASAGGPTASSAAEDDDDAAYAESDFEEDYDSAADEGTDDDDYDGSDVEADYGIEEDEMEELAEDELDDGSTEREAGDDDDDFVEPAAGRSEEEGERREGSGADDEHTGALGDAIEGSAEAQDWLDSRRMRTQYDHLKPLKLGMVVLPDALKKRIGATLKSTQPHTTPHTHGTARTALTECCVGQRWGERGCDVRRVCCRSGCGSGRAWCRASPSQ